MRFHFGQSDDAQVVIIPLFKETAELPIQEVNLKAHAGNRGAITWYYGRNGEQHLLFVGLGSVSAFESECLREAAGNAVRAVEREELMHVEVRLPDLAAKAVAGMNSSAAITAWVEGWLLGDYSFDKYKSRKMNRFIETVTFDLADNEENKEAAAWGEIRAGGIQLARDLGNEPANHMRPNTLAERVVERFADTKVEIKLYRGEELEQHRMCGLINVGRGSEHPPVMIEMRYCTDTELDLIALVGKGITFDTGGISLKRDHDISDMRIDMGGAAGVIGAMDILARSNAKANVVAIIPVAENMPDGRAMVPGDVLEYPNGLSVQVGNTDSEGRLVLADGLLHAHRLGAVEAVDMATLTYSCQGAIGSKYAGIWGHESTVSTIRSLGSTSGEKVWELPLADEYEDYLSSIYADVCNISSVGEAGAITAALFLRKFVHPSLRWAHIDMAAMKDASSTKGYIPAGATGYGARLLSDFVAARADKRSV
ncbi:leucyl aminopeptidase family protein [Paenibacillus marinisediminis]